MEEKTTSERTDREQAKAAAMAEMSEECEREERIAKQVMGAVVARCDHMEQQMFELRQRVARFEGIFERIGRDWLAEKLDDGPKGLANAQAFGDRLTGKLGRRNY